MSSSKIEVLQSWGIASARHSSGCTVHPGPGSDFHAGSSSEHLLDVPLGPSVVRWDLSTGSRLMQFQAHSDLIISARKSPDSRLIASSAYSGGVKLWSPEWACLDSTTVPVESQFHLAWSPDSSRLLVVSNGWKSCIIVFNVRSEDSAPRLEQAWTLQAADSKHVTSCTGEEGSGLGGASSEGGVGQRAEASGSTEGCSKGASGSQPESSRNYPYEDAYFMAEFNPSGSIFAVKELPYRTTQVQLISCDGRLSKTVDLMALVGDEDCSRRPVNTIFLSAFHEGVYAIGMEGGRVALLDAEQLHLNTVFKVGSGFSTCVWDGQQLLVPTYFGQLVWWSQAGEKVAEWESGLQDYVMHMDWSVSGRGLWLCGFSCLLYLPVSRNDAGVVLSVGPPLTVRGHKLTSVGVGFDPSGTKVASGDMVGSVWVTQREQVTPLHKFSVSGSVRCVTWVTEKGLLVGTLDGGLFWWVVGDSQPKLLLQRPGSIIHIRLDSSHKRLAVGTSKGMLVVYQLLESEREEDLQYNTVIEMSAHPPQPGPQDQRFGQLGKQAEIWSLCWSPDNGRLATCSEDQTVKVWDTHTWSSVAVLRGHALAVTSVDWRQVGKWSLLASCSDDRTVRLVNGDTYELVGVVNTRDIYGWHTLTYLSFYPHEGSVLLLCTTQNGHLVVWRVTTAAAGHSQVSPTTAPLLERLWKGKVHLGSVEGLTWQDRVGGGGVVTVGADCVVNLLRIVS